jgi:regulator of replication initiation timing
MMSRNFLAKFSIFFHTNLPLRSSVLLLLVLNAGCQIQVDSEAQKAAAEEAKSNPDKLLVVDCLLPAQIRKLGAKMTYLAQRRPIKTSAQDCEIRGGEYVAYDRADYRTALNVWLPRAKQGDSEAQTYVGEIFEKGLGIQADYLAAAAWYKKAAAQNNSRAQINLGFLYEKGLGVKKDLSQALNLYRMASGLGNDDSLQFTSTVMASAETYQQVDSLKKEVAQQKHETDTLKGELQTTRTKLKTKNKSLTTTKAKLQKLQKEVDNLQTNTATKPEQIATVKTSVSNQLDVTAQGPSIEILDPPIALMRGLPSIRLRSATTKRVIVGKVSAPAGLLSFTVNDNSEDVNKAGLFNVTIPVEHDRVPVKMVAVDNQGHKATIEFMIIPYARNLTPQMVKAGPPAPALKNALVGDVDFGAYHALIIGNNSYQYFSGLETAVNDAREAEVLLREKYGFKTRLLIDANRYEILSVLNDLRTQLTEKDNLLIYYAGHGELDRPNARGHWLPIDAEQSNSANWISNIALTDILNAMKAKHILVVADSCYSGSMSLSSIPRLDAEEATVDPEIKLKWLKVMAKVRSRTVLTSGGLQPVLDEGSGNHSVFASAFLSTLKNNDGVLEAYKLYRNLFSEVRQKAGEYGVDQQPEYSAIKHGGHEAGEFIFVPVI